MKTSKLKVKGFCLSIALVSLTTVNFGCGGSSKSSDNLQHDNANLDIRSYGWRGPDRSGSYHETGLLKTWGEDGPTLLWAVEDAGRGYSSPVVAGNRIFVTGMTEAEDIEFFSAYGLDGKKLYQVNYGTPWNETFPDTRTTPTIVGDKAYVISGAGEIVCISTADGKIVWKVNGAKKFSRKPGTWGTSESPLVFDNKVIYSPGGDKTTIVALNAATGKTVWKSKSLRKESTFISPLSITHNGKKQIIATVLGAVMGVNPKDGKIEWTFLTGHEGVMCNTPLYKEGRIYVSNGYDQGSFMLELNEDATAVEVLWRNDDLDTHHGGFVLVDGTIYGSNWLNNNSGNWVAVDWETGKTMYEQEWAERNKGSIITADGMLFVYDERRGKIGLVRATPEKFDLVSEFRITKGEGAHWSHPVIDNGILYVRRGSALMAYQIICKNI